MMTTASAGCGPGTVLVDGVCQLAPVESSGCGEGTVLKGDTCVLAESSGTSIPPLYIAGGAAAIGAAIIGIVFAVKRGSGTPKPAREELEEYESKYVARKPAEKKETSSSCNSCGTRLKPTAKFCGKCGTPRS
jgi:ribosomal protein L40E